jgi:cation:H+ antiporter
MVMVYILFIVGIFLLIKGADLLVEGAGSIARKLGVSSLVVGLTVVAFGTSMPELVVNVIAAAQGATGVAFGNIIGSNIANILLVLGITAIITPLKVKDSTFSKEIPFAILAAIVLLVFSNYLAIDNIAVRTLTRVSGIVMLCFFAIFLYYAFESARKDKQTLGRGVMEKGHIGLRSWILIVLGLVGLYFGGDWVVNGAIYAAQQFGFSEFLISSTVVAIGTSLPELVTAIVAARKKEVDLAVGNAVGSNIFNIFWILGITALIAPIVIPVFINYVILFLIAISILLMVFLYVGKKGVLSRAEGYIFLLLYVAYLAYIIYLG